MKVAVVGGGMAGLTAVYRLRQLRPMWEITLIESAGCLGGKVRTERAHGLTLEAAPDCFLSRKRWGVALCEELGIADELVGRKPIGQKAFVLRHGRLHPLPEGLTGMVPTNLEALRNHSLLSDEGLARLARESAVPRAAAGKDESVGGFMRRRLGDEAFENIVEPLMGGIYAGDADLLSLAATFPQLKAVEQRHGSLLGGLGAPSVPVGEGDYPPFVSFGQGMGRLVEALVARLAGVEVRLNTAVRRVLRHRTEAGWLVELGDEVLGVDGVILATPAHITAELLAEAEPEIAALHEGIAYVSTALVNLAYRREDALGLPDSYGYVIPKTEGREALACTWTSQKWHGRAPDEMVLLRVYIGRYGGADVTEYDDGRLLAIAQKEVAEMSGIGAEPIFRRIYRWPRALPQYNMGHVARVEKIEAAVGRCVGLEVAGAAYRGVGIPDCIREGDRAAVAMSKGRRAMSNE